MSMACCKDCGFFLDTDEGECYSMTKEDGTEVDLDFPLCENCKEDRAKDETYIPISQQLRECLLRIERSIELTIKRHQTLSEGLRDTIGEIDNIMGEINGKRV